MKFSLSLWIVLVTFSLSTKGEALLASVKADGMAGTGVAYPQDALTAAYNPANAAWIGDRVDLGGAWYHSQGTAKVSGNTITQGILNLLGGPVNGTYRSNSNNPFFPSFGVNKSFGPCDQYNVGLVVYNRKFFKTSYNKPFLLFGTKDLGLEYRHDVASAVFAWQINESFSVGLNLNYLFQRVKVSGFDRITQLTPAFLRPFTSKHPSHATNNGYDHSDGWGVTFGATWNIFTNLTLGAAFQPEVKMSRLKKYSGFFAQSGTLDFPAIYSAGFAWRWFECSTLTFDIQHYSWNEIPAMHNLLVFERTTLNQFGTKHGPGFGWSSQTFINTGIDYAISCNWIIRAGYTHVNVHVPSSQTLLNMLTLDTIKDYITCGATWSFTPSQEISAYFAYGLQNRKWGNGSLPSNILLGGDADLSNSSCSAGISWGWNY